MKLILRLIGLKMSILRVDAAIINPKTVKPNLYPWEHARSDCLIDIDVQEDFMKEGAPAEESYYGVNIVVVNYSDILLGDELKVKLKERDSSLLDQRCGTGPFVPGTEK